MSRLYLIAMAVTLWAGSASVLFAAGYKVASDHPRIFVNKADLPGLAARCKGPLAKQYAEIKQQADAAVKNRRIRYLDNKWASPTDLQACALAYLVERQHKREHRQYAELILSTWGDGAMLKNQDNCAFGFHAIAYDWIYDAMDDAQRKRYGDALGSWLTWYSGEAAIALKHGSWLYNKTWGPNHLNVMDSRDSIAQKLFVALAIQGAGTSHEKEARSFLDSWAKRIPKECIPAFDEMGGSWAESHGHGGYGPIHVIPWTFAAWESATGENLFRAGKPWSYLNEMSRWLTYLQLPHNGRQAYIDDGGGSFDSWFGSSAAPFVARSLRDPLAQWLCDQAVARGDHSWKVVVGYDPSLKALSPKEQNLPLGYLFKGASHVFMRSSWDDPNATWAFFGVGPHRVGHQHDDEGHFLISSRGGLVSKGAGQGSNDEDHYWGGSLAFNILTIFDPQETFRRDKKNENDGGLLRHVYDNSLRERGSIVGYAHNKDFTYAAGDLTKAYNSAKASEVSRQFLYLRGRPGRDEFFVVFDRVRSTRPDFAKHFMLHVPEEPVVSGTATEHVPDHVSSYAGKDLTSTWLSLPDDFGPKAEVLSKGRSRMILRTLLPREAVITKRGGTGHENWGHPLEPTAQYDHVSEKRSRPPYCRWRLEVAAPQEEQTYFLHVFQITDEKNQNMEPVRLLGEKPEVVLEIGPEKRPWRLSFACSGDIRASVQTPEARTPVRLGSDLAVEGQYE